MYMGARHEGADSGSGDLRPYGLVYRVYLADARITLGGDHRTYLVVALICSPRDGMITATNTVVSWHKSSAGRGLEYIGDLAFDLIRVASRRGPEHLGDLPLDVIAGVARRRKPVRHRRHRRRVARRRKIF